MKAGNSMRSWFIKKEAAKYSPDKSIENPYIQRCTDIEKNVFVFKWLGCAFCLFIMFMLTAELFGWLK